MSKINQRQNFATQLAQTSQDNFKFLFEAAPVGLVEGIWQTSFKVLSANPAVLKLFSSDSPEHFVSHFNDILVKMPRMALLELLSARVKGDLFEVELRLPSFKRNYIYVFMRLVYMPVSQVGPQHVLLAFHDITAIKKKETILKKLSQVDGLTELLNQRTIARRLEEEVLRAVEYQLDLSCVMIDLDNLKKINDTLGHPFGNKCIKQAARTMRNTFRKTDIIGRYGGDEFLVILPETTIENAGVPVERFLKNHAAHDLMEYKGKSIKTSFSIGISGFPAGAAKSAHDLMKAADRALYLSKTAGGNCYHLMPEKKLI